MDIQDEYHMRDSFYNLQFLEIFFFGCDRDPKIIDFGVVPFHNRTFSVVHRKHNSVEFLTIHIFFSFI